MSRPVFLSPTGQAPGRWREAFPQGLAWRTDVLDPASLAGDTVLWAHAPGDALPALVARLNRLRPDLPVVALDLQPAQATAGAVFEAGARGYCHTLATPAMLDQVAIVVSHGGLWVGPELMSRMVSATHRHLAEIPAPNPALDSLTSRERDVAEEVARGATNKEVARSLGITERTVKAHLGAVFAKLGVRDRLQLVLSLQAPTPTPTLAEAPPA